jgi:hypothetical protein
LNAFTFLAELESSDLALPTRFLTDRNGQFFKYSLYVTLKIEGDERAFDGVFTPGDMHQITGSRGIGYGFSTRTFGQRRKPIRQRGTVNICASHRR